MASSIGRNGVQVYSSGLVSLHHHHHHHYQQQQPVKSTPKEGTKKEGTVDSYWSRPESRIWTGMLLLGTCLLYCARVTMPICAVAMSRHFDWDKKQSGIVLSSFFWGYCLTQVIGGHLSDRYHNALLLSLARVLP